MPPSVRLPSSPVSTSSEEGDSIDSSACLVLDFDRENRRVRSSTPERNLSSSPIPDLINPPQSSDEISPRDQPNQPSSSSCESSLSSKIYSALQMIGLSSKSSVGDDETPES